VKKRTLLAALAGLAAAVAAKRTRARRAERDLWNEASAQPDLR
jgi:cob(I)alamin adenosyltransferase